MASLTYTALKTIWIKECTRFLRIWVQTLVPPAITMTLYFVIFGNIIGTRIDASGGMNGIPYMEFIVPGLIMMSVITNSYSNVASSFFSAKFQRNIEEMLVAPVSSAVIIAGYVGGSLARALIVACIVTVVSFIFVDNIQIYHAGILILTVVLTSTLFSLGGLINAVHAKTFDDISIVPTFVLTPLTYLGGVFFSISMLPEIWQNIAQINPVLYMVNAFRYGFLGVTDVNISLALGLLIGFNLILFALAYTLLQRGAGIRS